MQAVVKQCGGTITLQCKPSQAPPSARAGILQFECINPSQLNYFVEPTDHLSLDPTAATSCFVSGTAQNAQVRVPGLTGTNGSLPRVFTVGEWQAIARGNASLQVTFKLTGGAATTTVHQAAVPVRVI